MSRKDARRGSGGTHSKPPTRSAAGRRCEAQGCGTILSTYNSSLTCALHAQPTRRPPLAGSA